MVIIPADGDGEALVGDTADTDVNFARIQRGRTYVHVLEEPDATDIVEGRDEPTHFSGIRYVLGLAHVAPVPRKLFGAVLVRQFQDLIFPDHHPPGRHLVTVEELFLFVPDGVILREEKIWSSLTNNGEWNGSRRTCNNSEAIPLAPFKGAFCRNRIRKFCNLLWSIEDVACGHYFLECDEIITKNKTRRRLPKIVLPIDLHSFSFLSESSDVRLLSPLRRAFQRTKHSITLSHPAGAGDRIRTDGLRFTKPLLYQLSYPGLLQI